MSSLRVFIITNVFVPLIHHTNVMYNKTKGGLLCNKARRIKPICTLHINVIQAIADRESGALLFCNGSNHNPPPFLTK